jgi:hypothetical protein
MSLFIRFAQKIGKKWLNLVQLDSFRVLYFFGRVSLPQGHVI